MSAEDPFAAHLHAYWAVYHDVIQHGVVSPLSDPVCQSAVDGKARLNPGTAIAFAAQVFGLSASDIVGPSRMAPLVEARALVTWALRNCGEHWSYLAIGLALGDRDHSSASHLKTRADELRKRSARFRGACDDLFAHFNLAIEGDGDVTCN